MKNQLRISRTILSGCIIILILAITQGCNSRKKIKNENPNISEVLQSMADSLNKTYPQRDGAVEITSVEVLSNNTFQYNYKVNIDTAKNDMPKLRKKMRD